MRAATGIIAAGILLLHAGAASGQRAQRRAGDAPPKSVVMVPKNEQQRIDTALLLPRESEAGSAERSSTGHRKFKVRVVPAPPPGRSRQEILYSDSLAKMR